MNTIAIFNVYNTVVLIPWLAMFVFPQTRFTQRMVSNEWPVFCIGLSYLVLFVIDISTGTGVGIDFTSFESIKAAFARDEVLLIGWLHYLAFDLFVGFWIFEDAQKKRIKHLVLLPCLLFTLMLGPVGWLLYQFNGVSKRFKQKK